MADTRGTATLRNGQKVHLDDCVKIHNVLPSLTVGIAGSARSAVRLLDSILASLLQGSSAMAPETHAHMIDVNWMAEMIRVKYGEAVESGMLNPTDKFSYMF